MSVGRETSPIDALGKAGTKIRRTFRCRIGQIEEWSGASNHSVQIPNPAKPGTRFKRESSWQQVNAHPAPSAKRDVRNGYKWYEEQEPGLGEVSWNALKNALPP